MNDSLALVLSADTLTAALLGALLEIHGYRAGFPDSEEHPREALRRLRPAIVLVDCEYEIACTEAFFGPATMTGARVVMFSASQSRDDVSVFAAQFGFDWFILPADLAGFAHVMRAAPR